MFCGDVMVSDGTGGLIYMAWNSFFQAPVFAGKPNIMSVKKVCELDVSYA